MKKAERRAAIAPPATSRGVQITEALPDGYASTPICDWLSFTVFGAVAELAAEWCALLGGGVALERAALGYSHAWQVLGSGRVLINPERSEMGCHIDLSSKALRRFGGNVDQLVSVMLNENGKVTRLDLAVDTRQIAFSDLKRRVEGFEGLVTHFQRWRNGREGTRHEAFDTTVYLGSPTSDAMVRFYDKARERGVTGQWVRFEVQLRRERAHEVLLAWFSGKSIVGMLRGVVDFRVPEGKNQARWAVCDWWVRWLGAGDDVVRFTRTTSEKLIEEVRSWVLAQVAPSLALLLMADGGALDFYRKAAQEGAQRLKPWQTALLAGGAT